LDLGPVPETHFAHRIAMNPISLILPAVLGLLLGILLQSLTEAELGRRAAAQRITIARMNIMRFAAYLIVGFMLGLALPSFAAWLLAKLAGGCG
jgi:ABC-type methionine transport system permease subunit